MGKTVVQSIFCVRAVHFSKCSIAPFFRVIQLFQAFFLNCYSIYDFALLCATYSKNLNLEAKLDDH